MSAIRILFDIKCTQRYEDKIPQNWQFFLISNFISFSSSNQAFEPHLLPWIKIISLIPQLLIKTARKPQKSTHNCVISDPKCPHFWKRYTCGACSACICFQLCHPCINTLLMLNFHKQCYYHFTTQLLGQYKRSSGDLSPNASLCNHFQTWNSVWFFHKQKSSIYRL